METLVIKIRNHKAIDLLKDLELLDLIQIVPPTPKAAKKQKMSDMMRGSLSREEAETYHKLVKKTKDEWERNI